MNNLKLQKIIYGYRMFLAKNDADFLIKLHTDKNNWYMYNKKYIGIIVKSKGISRLCDIIIGLYIPTCKIGDKITIELNSIELNSIIKNPNKFIIPFANTIILNLLCYTVIHIYINNIRYTDELYMYGLNVDDEIRNNLLRSTNTQIYYSINGLKFLHYGTGCAYTTVATFDELKYDYVCNKSASVIQKVFRIRRIKDEVIKSLLIILPLELIYIILSFVIF